MAFGVIDESVKAYKVLTHRHRPEIERALETAGSAPVEVVFTPHLVPMQRGILTTVYAKGVQGVGVPDLRDALEKAYGDEPFVSLVEGSPETRWVVGSNRALISAHFDERTGIVVLLSAIDNLVKGAAGQAVQVANVMLDLDEIAGSQFISAATGTEHNFHSVRVRMNNSAGNDQRLCGVEVSYMTLYRFAVEELDFGRGATTIPVADCGPGEEIQLDTGWVGWIQTDTPSGSSPSPTL